MVPPLSLVLLQRQDWTRVRPDRLAVLGPVLHWGWPAGTRLSALPSARLAGTDPMLFCDPTGSHGRGHGPGNCSEPRTIVVAFKSSRWSCGYLFADPPNKRSKLNCNLRVGQGDRSRGRNGTGKSAGAAPLPFLTPQVCHRRLMPGPRHPGVGRGLEPSQRRVRSRSCYSGEALGESQGSRKSKGNSSPLTSPQPSWRTLTSTSSRPPHRCPIVTVLTPES